MANKIERVKVELNEKNWNNFWNKHKYTAYWIEDFKNSTITHLEFNKICDKENLLKMEGLDSNSKPFTVYVTPGYDPISAQHFSGSYVIVRGQNTGDEHQTFKTINMSVGGKVTLSTCAGGDVNIDMPIVNYNRTHNTNLARVIIKRTNCSDLRVSLTDHSDNELLSYNEYGSIMLNMRDVNRNTILLVTDPGMWDPSRPEKNLCRHIYTFEYDKNNNLTYAEKKNRDGVILQAIQLKKFDSNAFTAYVHDYEDNKYYYVTDKSYDPIDFIKHLNECYRFDTEEESIADYKQRMQNIRMSRTVQANWPAMMDGFMYPGCMMQSMMQPPCMPPMHKAKKKK